MKKLLTIGLIIFLIIPFINAQPDEYRIDSLTIEDGLACNGVSTIFKDSKGFMWFGTWMGLNRYDGYNFKTYKYDVTNPLSLSYNRVNDICEDRDGNLWIATANGLNKFDRQREIFIRFYSGPDDSTTLSSNNITNVFEDSSGNLWVGTNRVLNRFDKESKTFHRYKNDPDDPISLSWYGIDVIYEDKAGTLWIGAWTGGLNRYDRYKDRFYRFLIDPDNASSLSNVVTNIFEDKSGNFWVCTRNGLYRFDREKETFSRLLHEAGNPNSLDEQEVVAICEHVLGNYWIRTLDGLYLYNSALKKINKWQYIPDRKIDIVWNHSRSLYLDDSGTLWYCPTWRGIYKLTVQNKKFRHIPVAPFTKFVKKVWDIYVENEDIIWMAGSEGLTRFNRKKNKYDFYQPYPGDTGSIERNNISAVHKDRSGILWIGNRNGLHKVEISKDNEVRFINFIPRVDEEKNFIQFNISEGRSGRLFVSFFPGQTYIFDQENEHFFQLVDNWGNPNVGQILFEEESGVLWSSYRKGGLLKIFPPFKKVTSSSVAPSKIIQYEHDSENPNSLSGNGVGVVFKDRSGTIWLGTDVGGLNKIEQKKDELTGEISEQFVHYTTRDGLPYDDVSSIMEDENGNLWMGTEKGLSKFNPVTETFRNYDKSDGLWTLDVSGKSYCSPSGEMFFATGDGVLAFYPDSIRDNLQKPPIVITDLRLFNGPVEVGENSPLKQSISMAEEIELPFNQNTLSFEFAALNYINTDKNRYKYMMKGLDKEWIDAGTRRYAEYHGLNPGSYTFRIIGSNKDGVWNEEGASLSIIINPPWWKTVYAYTGYVVFLMLLIIGYVRWRTRWLEKEKVELEKQVKIRTRKIEEHEREIEIQKEKVEERNKQIEELDRVKTSFFANVSHEFRTPITLIQGPVEEVMEENRLSVKGKKKLGMVRRNAQRLMNLVNQLLDISKLDSGKMKLHLSESDIFETLRIITGSFSSLAETKGVIYKRIIPNIKKQVFFDAEILEKVAVNLLSNAFKFSPKGGEVVFIAQVIDGHKDATPEILEFSVTDQGTGIPHESQEKIFDRFYQVEGTEGNMGVGTGIGLSLTRDLVELSHGHITVDSEPGRGSTFTVRLPLGKEHFKESEYVISEKREEFVTVEPIMVNGLQDAAAFEKEEAPPAKRSQKPIVLIVEDNRDIRIHINDNLKEEYRVIEAVNGSTGLKKALDTIPDLIITDLMMPKMDGLEMCERLKSDERTSHIPVVMLTAKVTLEDKLEGFESGADDYISKPFQMKELKARVHNLIEQRRKLRERFSREVKLEPKEIAITSLDEAFLNRAIETIEKHMGDEKFDLGVFKEEMNMSRSTLSRKLRSLTNQSPTDFIRTIRLKRAARLIEQHYGNIANIAYEVGFNNPSYFSKCFKEIFGVSPAEYSKS